MSPFINVQTYVVKSLKRHYWQSHTRISERCLMDDCNLGAIDISSIDRDKRVQSTLNFERALGRSKKTLMRTNVKN